MVSFLAPCRDAKATTFVKYSVFFQLTPVGDLLRCDHSTARLNWNERVFIAGMHDCHRRRRRQSCRQYSPICCPHRLVVLSSCRYYTGFLHYINSICAIRRL